MFILLPLLMYLTTLLATWPIQAAAGLQMEDQLGGHEGQVDEAQTTSGLNDYTNSESCAEGGCCAEIEGCETLCNQKINSNYSEFPYVNNSTWTYEAYIKCHPTFKAELEHNITEEQHEIKDAWYYNYFPSYVDYAAEPWIDPKTSYMCEKYNTNIADYDPYIDSSLKNSQADFAEQFKRYMTGRYDEKVAGDGLDEAQARADNMAYYTDYKRFIYCYQYFRRTCWRIAIDNATDANKELINALKVAEDAENSQGAQMEKTVKSLTELIEQHQNEIEMGSNACLESMKLSFEYQYFYLPQYKYTEKFLRYTSMVLSLFGSLLILKNPRLQSHPYKTLSVMLLLDSGIMFQFDLTQDIFRAKELFNFPNISLWGLSLWRSKETILKHQYYYLSHLYCSNQITLRVFQYSFISINYGLTWDLLKSVQEPFESVKTRHQIIMAALPSVSLVMLIYVLGHEILNLRTLRKQHPQCGTFRFDYMLSPGEVIIQMCYFIYTFYALCIVSRGLLKKGMNREIKKTFIKRQFAYVLILLLSQLPVNIYKTVLFFERKQFQAKYDDQVDKTQNPAFTGSQLTTSQLNMTSTYNLNHDAAMAVPTINQSSTLEYKDASIGQSAYEQFQMLYQVNSTQVALDDLESNFFFYLSTRLFAWQHISFIIYESRGILLFLWMMSCPLFRQITLDNISKSICKPKKLSLRQQKRDKELKGLETLYNNTNSFLYSSLNMEIVCSILKGINTVLREINSVDRTSTILKFIDFKEKRVVHLKTIQVLNRAYFENFQAEDIQKVKEGLDPFEQILLTETQGSLYSRASQKVQEDFFQQKILHEDIEVNVKVTSYAPQVFKFIRAIDKINEIEIMKSVKPELNRMQIFKTNSNQSHSDGGQSGSFFFFTEDKRYIIKTMTLQEKRNMMAMLPSMAKYMMETAGKSIISRVYGIYKVKYPGMNRIYLMLQRNNMQVKKYNELLNSFDLKGSTYRRKVIDDRQLRNLLDKNQINKRSVGHDSTEDSRKMGETMNKTNIAQKLRMQSVSGSFRRKSSKSKTKLNTNDSEKNNNKEELEFENGREQQFHYQNLMAPSPLQDEDADEKLLQLMEIKTKQNILRTLGRNTLKDVDYEQLVLNNVLCLAISEEDVVLIMNTLKRDLAFLNDNSLMDYSLLLGIEKINHIKPGHNEKNGPQNQKFKSTAIKKATSANTKERSHSFNLDSENAAKKSHQDSSFLMTLKQQGKNQIGDQSITMDHSRNHGATMDEDEDQAQQQQQMIKNLISQSFQQSFNPSKLQKKLKNTPQDQTMLSSSNEHSVQFVDNNTNSNQQSLNMNYANNYHHEFQNTDNSFDHGDSFRFQPSNESKPYEPMQALQSNLFSQSRGASKSELPVRKTNKKANKNNQQPNLDNQTNFMIEVSNIAAQNVDGLKLGEPIRSTCGNYIYHVSIIDYLQKYDIFKKIERLHKQFIKGAKGSEISSIDANSYKTRFMKFMVDKILSHEFNHRVDESSKNQAALRRTGSAMNRKSRKKSGVSSHVVDDMEMIDNFYSRYTSMTGEENPHQKQPNYKLTTMIKGTMIKDPNAHTAEHSQLQKSIKSKSNQGRSDQLHSFQKQYSINEPDDFDDGESVTSEQAESRMLQKMGFGARASRAAPQPSFKLPAQKPIAKSNRISHDKEQADAFDDLALQLKDEKPEGRASELVTRKNNMTADEKEEDSDEETAMPLKTQWTIKSNIQ